MRIGIVGNGVVGSATARTYLEHVAEVRVADSVKERATHRVSDVLDCDLAFICLPEAFLEDFFSTWDLTGVNVVVKSTCPIGTTKRLAKQHGLTSVCHSPEFLTARVAHTDALLPARNIVGGPDSWNPCCRMLKGLYEARFPGVQILTMHSDESEAVKLFVNSFFAVKIALFNEFRALADELDLDWDAVLAGMLSDGRISHSHTKVPGPDGKFGFGGTCLPKDLRQLVKIYEEHDVKCSVLPAAYIRNELDRSRT